MTLLCIPASLTSVSTKQVERCVCTTPPPQLCFSSPKPSIYHPEKKCVDLYGSSLGVYSVKEEEGQTKTSQATDPKLGLTDRQCKVQL